MRCSIPRLRVLNPMAGAGNVPNDPSSEHQVWRDAGGRPVAVGATIEGENRLTVSGVGEFVWRDGDEVIAIRPEPGSSDESLVDAFERAVLPLALQARGMQALHASAVDTPRGVVAFCARSQTGKSTLASACARQWSRPVWADDVVAVSCAASRPMAVALPFTVKLRAATSEHFGMETLRMSVAGGPAAGCTRDLLAVFVLERVDRGHGSAPPPESRPASAEPLAAADAFPALLEHAYCFDLEDPSRRRHTVDQYLELSARLPVFRLRFTASFESLPSMIGEVAETIEEIADTAGVQR